MAEISHQGVMAMVKINGDRVKQLREQKGLTQLYVATVVQVTTDTISRWENKRYPTIKKENGIRLAEALEVPLEDILMVEDEISQEPENISANSAELRAGQPASTTGRRVTLRMLLGVACILSIVGGIYSYFQKQAVALSARRIMPQVCTVGQPFPVAIEVDIPARAQLAIIVKEQIPDGVVVKGAHPPLPNHAPKSSSLKWLKKIEGKALFTYIAVLKEPSAASRNFSGSVASGNDGGTSFPITGPSAIRPTAFHWADTDGDNSINDQEILAVYDQFGDLEELGLDIDLIEEIWLGSGYSWNEKKKTYDILP